VTPIFDALASLTAQVTAPSGLRVLTIGVGPTFAMRWLIPRLADSQGEARHRPPHPRGREQLPRATVAAGITLGDGNCRAWSRAAVAAD